MSLVRPDEHQAGTWNCRSGPGPDKFGLGPWVKDPKGIQCPVQSDKTLKISERGAKACGYPERFAQEALGHTSQSVHAAYAKATFVVCSALDEYEATAAQKIIKLPRIAAT